MEERGAQRQFFQRFLPNVWKSGACKGNSSKDFSSVFGRMRYSKAVLPKISPQRLEDRGAQGQFFQRFLPNVWKTEVLKGNSSKDFSSAFGRMRYSKAVLPKISPQRLEERGMQRQFFQRFLPSVWKTEVLKGKYPLILHLRHFSVCSKLLRRFASQAIWNIRSVTFTPVTM